jgi:hypothetical protein
LLGLEPSDHLTRHETQKPLKRLALFVADGWLLFRLLWLIGHQVFSPFKSVCA